MTEPSSRNGLSLCRRCKELRPSDAFYVFLTNGKPYVTKVCKRCARVRQKQSAEAFIERRGRTTKPPAKKTPSGMTGKERYAYWATYRMRQGCADCDRRDTWQVLEFDHLPQFEKSFTISDAVRRVGVYSDQEIASEVAKCEVVCRDCHRVRTKQRKWEVHLRDTYGDRADA